MRTSVLPEHASLEGEIRGSGDLAVRGLIIGAVDLDGVLTIEATGVIRGEVRARAMVVRGVVEGPVTVLELLRLEVDARVIGDVQAERVSAATGAVLRGRVRMTGADRLRRTVGGTVTAPFTSSGALEAPRISAHLEPVQVRTLAPEEIDVREIRAEVRSESLHGIRQRVTETPSDRVGRGVLRTRTTESPEVRAAPAPSTPASLGGATGPPPSPVIPKLGRVRSRRREDIGP